MDKLVNSIDLPLFLIDGMGTVLKANLAAMERFSLEQRDIGSTTIWEKIPFTLASEWKKEISKVIQKLSFQRFQFDHDGRIKELFIWPAFGQDKRLDSFALIEKDITDNIHALELHRRFKDNNECTDHQILHASTLINLGTLVAGMAHEINNPNAFITTNAPLLERLWEDFLAIIYNHMDDRLQNPDLMVGGLTIQELRETVPKLLRGITEGALRIDTIVKSLRSFSRPDPHAAFVPVCLNSVIRTALLFLSNEIPKATHHFYTHLDNSLPKIAAIPQRLEQVVINLILNACQALTHSDQTIILETKNRFEDETELKDRTSRATVILKVTDQGSGIDSQTLGKIFDPFFTTKMEIKGTGLGLTITRKIVKEHHGQISFKSRPGAGTSVTVEFPAMEGG
jgi:signal transduction histidine kinase